jgi:3-hydroxyisobutyrate dehydrogenase-like beta-hydroxyacid dehydrogenase
MEAGYLGVGAMGQPMAHKLIDAGHSLTIYDINELAMQPLLERQARRGVSPRDLADRCEIVFVSLPTLAAFREVGFGADGLIHGTAMKLLVNTCTVGVPFVREIDQAMAERGVTFVDCPISGGPPGARAGTLSVMVSGDPAAVEQVRPMISLWGRTLTCAAPGLSPAMAFEVMPVLQPWEWTSTEMNLRTSGTASTGRQQTGLPLFPLHPCQWMNADYDG